MTMTLEQVRARLKYLAQFGGSDGLDVHQMCIECSQLADRLTHLTQPAQSVDVEKIHEVISELNASARNSCYTSVRGAELAWAKMLTAALQEKGNG